MIKLTQEFLIEPWIEGRVAEREFTSDEELLLLIRKLAAFTKDTNTRMEGFR